MRVAKTLEIETVSGLLPDLICPDLDDVSITDVAHGLARICRFGGACRDHYSVAQHSCVVASMLSEEERIHGLLHDAPEYVLGDLATPVKTAIAFVSPDFPRAWRWLNGNILRHIYEKVGVELPGEDVRARVKQADLAALATEQRDIMASPNVWSLPYPPSNRKIVPVNADAARLMYLDALAECGVDVGFAGHA